MDAKWKSQLQQDYCMTLYEVLPMGKNVLFYFLIKFIYFSFIDWTNTCCPRLSNSFSNSMWNKKNSISQYGYCSFK